MRTVSPAVQGSCASCAVMVRRRYWKPPQLPLAKSQVPCHGPQELKLQPVASSGSPGPSTAAARPAAAAAAVVATVTAAEAAAVFRRRSHTARLTRHASSAAANTTTATSSRDEVRRRMFVLQSGLRGGIFGVLGSQETNCVAQHMDWDALLEGAGAHAPDRYSLNPEEFYHSLVARGNVSGDEAAAFTNAFETAAGMATAAAKPLRRQSGLTGGDRDNAAAALDNIITLAVGFTLHNAEHGMQAVQTATDAADVFGESQMPGAAPGVTAAQFTEGAVAEFDKAAEESQKAVEAATAGNGLQGGNRPGGAYYYSPYHPYSYGMPSSASHNYGAAGYGYGDARSRAAAAAYHAGTDDAWVMQQMAYRSPAPPSAAWQSQAQYQRDVTRARYSDSRRDAGVMTPSPQAPSPAAVDLGLPGLEGLPGFGVARPGSGGSSSGIADATAFAARLSRAQDDAEAAAGNDGGRVAAVAAAVKAQVAAAPKSLEVQLQEREMLLQQQIAAVLADASLSDADKAAALAKLRRSMNEIERARGNKKFTAITDSLANAWEWLKAKLGDVAAWMLRNKGTVFLLTNLMRGAFKGIMLAVQRRRRLAHLSKPRIAPGRPATAAAPTAAPAVAAAADGQISWTESIYNGVMEFLRSSLSRLVDGIKSLLGLLVSGMMWVVDATIPYLSLLTGRFTDLLCSLLHALLQRSIARAVTRILFLTIPVPGAAESLPIVLMLADIAAMVIDGVPMPKRMNGMDRAMEASARSRALAQRNALEAADLASQPRQAAFQPWAMSPASSQPQSAMLMPWETPADRSFTAMAAPQPMSPPPQPMSPVPPAPWQATVADGMRSLATMWPPSAEDLAAADARYIRHNQASVDRARDERLAREAAAAASAAAAAASVPAAPTPAAFIRPPQQTRGSPEWVAAVEARAAAAQQRFENLPPSAQAAALQQAEANAERARRMEEHRRQHSHDYDYVF